jgi:hypothetical protein
MIVRDDITLSDKPWIAVDETTGTGQHDVYLTCFGSVGSANGLWLSVSTDGRGGAWSTPLLIRASGTDTAVNSPIVVAGPNHVSYVFWYERNTNLNYLKMRQVLNRGSNLGPVQVVRPLVTTNAPNGNLELKRSNTATNTDTFRAFPFPVPAVNPDPAKSNHLYVAFADKGTNTNDKADVFFIRSSDGGTSWTNLTRVNTDAGTNDQWMPVLAVRPDGAKLFMAWYDRRNDTNNARIDVYGRWGTIATNGSVSFETEFRLSTTNFPMVFAGTDTNSIPQGHYDPVYPPGGVNLHWHYPEWLLGNESDPNLTPPTYKDHVGEYNGVCAEGPYVYLSWTDYRLTAVGTLYARNQGDIRLIRITWP